MKELLISRYVAILEINPSLFIVTHLLARCRVICTHSELEYLLNYSIIDNEDDALNKNFLSANLLQSRQLNEEKNIIQIYNLELFHPNEPKLIKEEKNLKLAFNQYNDLNQAVFASSVKSITSMDLGNNTFLITHALGNPVHLDKNLWELWKSFCNGKTIKHLIDEYAGQYTTEQIILSMDFFLSRKMIWRTEKSELDTGKDFIKINSQHGNLVYPPTNRWRQKYKAYEIKDLKKIKKYYKVLLVGPCQIQLLAEAIEYLSQEMNIACEIDGVININNAIPIKKYDLAVFTTATFSALFFEAVAAENEEECQRLLLEIISKVDHAIDKIRYATSSPILVVGLSHPGLTKNQGFGKFSNTITALISQVNTEIQKIIENDEGVFLLTEDQLLQNGFLGRYWDDEYNALPHHSAISNWSWVVLKSTMSPGMQSSQFANQNLPAPSSMQVDPAYLLSKAILQCLQRLDCHNPIRLILFDPNQLLWQGCLETFSTDELKTPNFFADVEEYVYAGINEALSVLLKSGVKLACVSSCSPEIFKEKWNIKSTLLNVVRYEDLSFVIENNQVETMLSSSLSALNVNLPEILYINLNTKILVNYFDHEYIGDIWNLRRFLLTYYKLYSLSKNNQLKKNVSSYVKSIQSSQVTQDTQAATEHFNLEEIVRDFYIFVAEQLKCEFSVIEFANDLRLLGLDSLGGVKLMNAIENHFNISFDMMDFTEATIFYRQGLTAAFIRSMMNKNYQNVASEKQSSLWQGLNEKEWCSQNWAYLLIQAISKNANRIVMKLIHNNDQSSFISGHDLLCSVQGYIDYYAKNNLSPQDTVIITLPTSLSLYSALIAAIAFDLSVGILPFPGGDLDKDSLQMTLDAALKAKAKAIVCDNNMGNFLKNMSKDFTDKIIVLAEEPRASNIFSIANLRYHDASHLIQFSSGTTDSKKCYRFSQKQVLTLIWHFGHALELNSNDKIISWLTLSHPLGLIASTLIPFMTGVPIVSIPAQLWANQPHLLFREISAEKCTMTFMPNSALKHIVKYTTEEQLYKINLLSLRALICSGEPIYTKNIFEFYQKFLKYGLKYTSLITDYGMTEAISCISQVPTGHSPTKIKVTRSSLHSCQKIEMTSEEDIDSVELISCGYPIKSVRVAIFNDQGHVLEAGFIGEICIDAEHVVDMALNPQVETSQFYENTWFKTGDLGFLYRDELFVTGRKKELIICNGLKITPHDAESIVTEINNEITAVVAFGFFDSEKQTENLMIVAEVTNSFNTPENIAILKGQIRKKILTVFHVNVYNIIIAENSIARTASGKLSRLSTRKKYLKEFAGKNELSIN